jgi:very-short-patch-repair endonuclease
MALIEPATESPLETMLRLLLALGGLPPPVPQFEVRAGTRLLGRADFAYPDARLVLECDGRAYHQEWAVGVRDRRRQNSLVVDAGLRVLRFTHDDLCFRPAEVVGAVRAALT